jgi:hypothetical protein
MEIETPAEVASVVVSSVLRLAEEYARMAEKVVLILKVVRRKVQVRGLDRFSTGGGWNSF